MHQVVHGIADKRITVILLAQQCVPVKTKAATGRNVTGGFGMVKPLEGSAERVQQSGIGPSRDGDAWGGRSNVSIAADVVIGQGIMPGECAVITTEPVAPIVTCTALLREAADRLKLASIRVHAKIAAADIHCERRCRAAVRG